MTINEFLEGNNFVILPELKKLGIDAEVITEYTAVCNDTDRAILAFEDEGSTYIAFLSEEEIEVRNYFTTSTPDMTISNLTKIIEDSTTFQKVNTPIGELYAIPKNTAGSKITVEVLMRDEDGQETIEMSKWELTSYEETNISIKRCLEDTSYLKFINILKEFANINNLYSKYVYELDEEVEINGELMDEYEYLELIWNHLSDEDIISLLSKHNELKSIALENVTVDSLTKPEVAYATTLVENKLINTFLLECGADNMITFMRERILEEIIED